jgi:predicted glycosyltransferase
LFTLLPEAELSPSSLADRIGEAVRRPPPASIDIDLEGAPTTARLVAGLAGQPSPHRRLA